MLTLTGGVTIAPGDLVSVLVYDGTDIYTLPSEPTYTTTRGLGHDRRRRAHATCTTTGCVTVKLVIQRAAVHGASDVKLYNGSEPVVAGQPVLDAGNKLQYDAERPRRRLHGLADDADRPARRSTGSRAASTHDDHAQPGTATTAQQPQGRGRDDDAHRRDYTLTGSTLYASARSSRPAHRPGSSRITITYTGAVLHSRGEPVYNVCSGTRTSNTCVEQTYTAGSAVLTLGSEPVLYTGGEQAYYSTTDPVLVPVQENRITVSGTGGLPDDVIYSGLASVTVQLGGGANHVTVDTTPFGAIVARHRRQLERHGRDHLAHRADDDHARSAAPTSSRSRRSRAP